MRITSSALTATHFECYSLLSAMGVTTTDATRGALVTCNSYATRSCSPT